MNDAESAPAGEIGSFVQSLERGLSVLSAFGAEAPSMTIADAARRTGLTRAAARRSLHTLATLGYLSHHSGRFAMTPKVLDLARAFLTSSDLDRVARPHLERLVQVTKESSSLGVLDFPDVVYAVHVPAYRIDSFVPVVGSRMPAYINSMGRVLLAQAPPETRRRMLESYEIRRFTAKTIADVAALDDELAAVRAQGWALVDQEFSEGVRSIAAPVTDADGRVVAAVNVTSSAARFTAAQLLDIHLPTLLQTTAKISAEYQGNTNMDPPAVRS
jgi:IclR family transcriptional regulator, pca regulon regulatory protein